MSLSRRQRAVWLPDRYVFGIDGLQVLHLAMKRAPAVAPPLELATRLRVWR